MSNEAETFWNVQLPLAGVDGDVELRCPDCHAHRRVSIDFAKQYCLTRTVVRCQRCGRQHIIPTQK